ncbi:MAG: hypothetical protein V4535_08200 [Bacteroidota bacterium]
MIIQTESTPGKFSTFLALTSFGIGTLFLILHLLFENAYIIFCGYLFVLAAILVNIITLLYLLYLLIFSPFDRETILIRILILLSNIPIALLYLNIVLNNHLFN